MNKEIEILTDIEVEVKIKEVTRLIGRPKAECMGSNKGGEAGLAVQARIWSEESIR